jgi:ribonuclease P protein component
MNNAAQTPEAGSLEPGPFRLDSSKYKAVFAEKSSFYGQMLVIWVARMPDAGRRAGVVVSKRTFRRAVDRNRAKRLMREAFRLSRHRVSPDVGLILIARNGIAGKKCQDVMRDFERVCRRAKVWLAQRTESGANA